jgi:lincosamide nucleotidyltransferase B/F
VEVLMLQQEIMIERLREVCERDGRLVAALMYGSFALGQGDEYSDIEFYLFFSDEALGDVNQEAWLAQVSPVALYYVNEFGNGAAIFDNLVRGEFHFERASDVGLVDAWETAYLPSLESTVLADKDGELSRGVGRLVGGPPDLDTPQRALFVCRSLVNWTLMGTNLLKRGEYARAHAFLSLVHGHLLRAARLSERDGQLAEPFAQAGGRPLARLLRAVQSVHGGAGRRAAGASLRGDVGVESRADGRTRREARALAPD